MIEEKRRNVNPPLFFLGIMGIVLKNTINSISLKYNNYSQNIPKKLLLLRVLRLIIFPKYSQNCLQNIPQKLDIPQNIPQNHHEWAPIIIPKFPLFPKIKMGSKV